MTDEELDLKKVVKNATEKAEEIYPKRSLTGKTKLTVLIIGALVIGNSILGIVNTALIDKQTACQTARSTQLTMLRNQDTATIDKAFNDILNANLSGKLTQAQLIAKFRVIQNTYNQSRAEANVSRDQITATTCK